MGDGLEREARMEAGGAGIAVDVAFCSGGAVLDVTKFGWQEDEVGHDAHAGPQEVLRIGQTVDEVANSPMHFGWVRVDRFS